MSIQLGDLVLNENFDCLCVEAIDGDVAECCYTTDFKGEEVVRVPIAKLSKLTPKTAASARKYLNIKIGRLSGQLKEITDCANQYV